MTLASRPLTLIHVPRQHLDLSHNAIATEVCENMGEAIRTHIALTEINLAHCKLSNAGAAHIVKAIADQGEIKILVLEGNKIGGVGGQKFLLALEQMLSLDRCNLKELHLGWNVLLPQQINKNFASALGKNCSLELLDLSWVCQALLV